MKRMRDKIVGELTQQPTTGSFNKGLFTGVILGAAITLVGGAYMNSAITNNTLLRASMQSPAQVPAAVSTPEAEQPAVRVKAIQYTDKPDLTLPPPFEATPSQTAGKEYSI